MANPQTPTLQGEAGSAVIEGLLALTLVGLVFAVGVQAFAYAHTRAVATAAAQEGARDAATDGTMAGINRAQALLEAAGGAGANLTAQASQQPGQITITVAGHAPSLFPLSLLLPDVETQASLPLERYPDDEAAQP